MVLLDHLTITVRDVARSRAWYAESFGFTVERAHDA
jgi:catechol 2,3-dioxygenase-like lactoylglutathione lyase family enzyme